MVQGPNVQLQLSHCDGLDKQLGVHAFGCAFGALVASFEKQKFESDRKESLPYPVFILMKWERRILQSNTPLKEVIISGGFLLLCWSGLRFSDLQRCRLSTWQLDSTSLRGLTWRAKTCNSSTPFGVVTSGLLSKGTWTWIHKFLSTLDTLYAGENPNDIDFALPTFGNQDTPIIPFDAMTYAEALFYIRYYMALPWRSTRSSSVLEHQKLFSPRFKSNDPILGCSGQSARSGSQDPWQTSSSPGQRTIILT